MEEMTVMMISSPSNIPMSESSFPRDPITTSTSPTWKLYHNPFYNNNSPPQHNSNSSRTNPVLQQHSQIKHLRPLHLPLSARKIAASFWDLTFVTPVMETDQLDIARAQIVELKAELEYERKLLKKLETLNKRLAKELAEERRGREALVRVCEELAREVSSDKAEIDRMKREIEEERKMLRMADVLREERVQMKLAEAKIVLEEKLLELEATKQTEIGNSTNSKIEEKNSEAGSSAASKAAAIANLRGRFNRLVLGEKSYDDSSNTGANSREFTRAVLSERCSSNNNDNMSSSISWMAIQRRASPEPENPHIKRGIKGFVEFPRVVRAVGPKGSRHWGTKLECQKAQLKILLKQKCPIRSNNLIIS